MLLATLHNISIRSIEAIPSTIYIKMYIHCTCKDGKDPGENTCCIYPSRFVPLSTFLALLYMKSSGAIIYTQSEINMSLYPAGHAGGLLNHMDHYNKHHLFNFIEGNLICKRSIPSFHF